MDRRTSAKLDLNSRESVLELEIAPVSGGEGRCAGNRRKAKAPLLQEGAVPGVTLNGSWPPLLYHKPKPAATGPSNTRTMPAITPPSTGKPPASALPVVVAGVAGVFTSVTVGAGVDRSISG